MTFNKHRLLAPKSLSVDITHKTAIKLTGASFMDDWGMEKNIVLCEV